MRRSNGSGWAATKSRTRATSRASLSSSAWCARKRATRSSTAGRRTKDRPSAPGAAALEQPLEMANAGRAVGGVRVQEVDLLVEVGDLHLGLDVDLVLDVA